MPLAQGLAHTLFERLQGLHGERISHMLTVQYRMNSAIMRWSSDALYAGRLTAHPSVADHTLLDLRVSTDRLVQLSILERTDSG